MIRPFTLLCFCAFAGAGAWLYQVKHSVSELDRKLVEVRRDTEQARQRIDILRAEWALLNEPERLRQTAQRVLTLEGMQPQQFVRLTDLDRRLPAAVAFAGAPNLFEIAPAARQAEPPVMLASAPVARPAATPAPAPVQPAVAAAPPPAARAPESPAPHALAAAVAQQRADVAQQRAESAARPAPRPAPPRPIQPAVHITPAAPAPSQPVRVTRATPPETTVASALGGAIVGGGRPLLPPPIPVSPAAAATLDGMRGASPAR